MIKNKYIQFIIIFLSPFIFSIQTAGNEINKSHLDILLEKWDASPSSGLSFTDKTNAFYPYRHRHFDAGLLPEEKAQLMALQEAGQCSDQLGDHLVAGFSKLYPFLKPAFDDPNRAWLLTRTITHAQISPVDRCIYFRRLNALRQKTEPQKFDPIEIDGGPIFTQTHRPDGDRGAYWDELYSLNVSLGSLAFCQDYPPSIEDLMRKANQPGGLVISKQEAIYLAARAMKHDLIGQPDLRMMQSGLRITPALQALFREAETSRMTELPVVAGVWQAACREIEGMARSRQ